MRRESVAGRTYDGRAWIGRARVRGVEETTRTGVMATVNQVVERGCSMLVHFDRATSAVELKEALETGSAEEKADAMKKVISW